MKSTVRYYPVLASTNEILAGLILSENPEEGTVIRAGYQTEGKGHQGNSWQSEADKNLLCSILLKPDFLPPLRQFDLSRIFCLALMDLLIPYCKPVWIKWPNDIYAGQRKIAGILIENSLQGNRIVNTIGGVGLNLNQSVFDPAIPSPTSLFIEKGCHFDIQVILEELLEHLGNWYGKLKDGIEDEIHFAYKQNLYLLNTLSGFRDADGEFKGQILDVLPAGELLIEREDGQKRKFGFKEIEYLQ